MMKHTENSMDVCTPPADQRPPVRVSAPTAMFAAACIALFTCGLSACAIGPGSGWGELTGEVSIQWDQPAARFTDDGLWRTANSYGLDLETLELSVASLEFVTESQSAGGGSVDFDPANPPPGYSLCHGGHCHADDGSLPTYEEIRRRLAGGGGVEEQVLASVKVPATILLAKGATVPITESRCLPSCSVDEEVRIARVRLPLLRLRASGTVVDLTTRERLGGMSQPWTLDIDLTDLALAESVDLPIGRGSDPVLNLLVDVEIPARIFDGIDWPAAFTSPTSSAAVEEMIIENLLSGTLDVALQP
jgi:hypothetical protein